MIASRSVRPSGSPLSARTLVGTEFMAFCPLVQPSKPLTRRALEDAGVKPEEINYISPHSSGKQENDRIKNLAIRRVFGEFAGKVPICSVKSMLGHLIAAAGACELVTCVLALRDGIIRPTTNCCMPDLLSDLDYVPNKPRKVNVRTCLSNSFGFGGQNDPLVIRAFSK